ncbi:MAG TPA: hypothetical protein VL025_14845 [Thermoanaerobaculia bacterium]|nr:hypothetical protein [Thermoanaerobaculia bacterium]
MMRKTISFVALTLLLTAGLAFAGSEPAAAPAPSAPSVQAAPADAPVSLDLAEIFGGDSCAPQPASRYPGCSKTCKVDRDCPAYPDQVCVGGCCVY